MRKQTPVSQFSAININVPLSLATPSVLRLVDANGKPPLWQALEHHDDIEVIQLLISRHPEALVSVVGGLCIVHFFDGLPAENCLSNHDEIIDLMWGCYIAF